MEDQEAGPYLAWNEAFKEITLHDAILKGRALDPNRMEMFHMACYDLDRFRRFVLESSFLERFEVAPETVERIRSDDEELLRLGFRWARFALFNDPGLKIREEVVKAKLREAGLEGERIERAR
jgi:hypothetical protein